MSVVNSIEDAGPCRKMLTIEVPAPAVEAETLRVVNDLRHRVQVPGFRKGHVPTRLIAQRHKKEIEAEVLERLLPRYWRQAEAESGIEPMLPPEVQGELHLEAGEPLVFQAAVEVKPVIELGDLDGFDLPDFAPEPTEEEVRDAIDDLRRRFGNWVPVERSAAQGDLVDVRVRVVKEGEDAQEEDAKLEESQPFPVEVGNKEVWEELSVAITGLTAGQSADFSRGEDNEAGETVVQQYRLRVATVKERELPELDEEFAQTVGDFDSVEALETAMKDRLRDAKTRARDQQRRRALMDQLRQRHPLELPEGVVQKETENILREYAGDLASQGVDVERAGIDWQAIAERARPEAVGRVHGRLLLDAVARKQELVVSEAEFESALAGIAKAQNTSTVSVRQALDRSDRLAPLRAQMLRDKTIRFLLGEDTDLTAAANDSSAGSEESSAAQDD